MNIQYSAYSVFLIPALILNINAEGEKHQATETEQQAASELQGIYEKSWPIVEFALGNIRKETQPPISASFFLCFYYVNGNDIIIYSENSEHYILKIRNNKLLVFGGENSDKLLGSYPCKWGDDFLKEILKPLNPFFEKKRLGGKRVKLNYVTFSLNEAQIRVVNTSEDMGDDYYYILKDKKLKFDRVLGFER